MILGTVDAITLLTVLMTLGVCLTAPWSWLTVANHAGIPRYVPTGLAVLLAVVAVVARSRASVVFRFLACYWSLGALCFARPALTDIGVSLRLELLVGIMAGVLFAADRIGPSSKAIRRALLTAAGLPVIIFAVAFLPASAWLGATAYGLIFAVAVLSLAAVQASGERRWKST